MKIRDPYHGFKLERVGSDCYQLTPKRQSIRLPKCYTSSRSGTGEWFITNHFGKMLKRGSDLHIRISAACEFQYSGREHSLAEYRANF